LKLNPERVEAGNELRMRRHQKRNDGGRLPSTLHGYTKFFGFMLCEKSFLTTLFKCANAAWPFGEVAQRTAEEQEKMREAIQVVCCSRLEGRLH
jgi:hypothetical protein